MRKNELEIANRLLTEALGEKEVIDMSETDRNSEQEYGDWKAVVVSSIRPYVSGDKKTYIVSAEPLAAEYLANILRDVDKGAKTGDKGPARMPKAERDLSTNERRRLKNTNTIRSTVEVPMQPGVDVVLQNQLAQVTQARVGRVRPPGHGW